MLNISNVSKNSDPYVWRIVVHAVLSNFLAQQRNAFHEMAIAHNGLRLEDLDPERDIVVWSGDHLQQRPAYQDFIALVSLCNPTLDLLRRNRSLVNSIHDLRWLVASIYDLLIETGYRFFANRRGDLVGVSRKACLGVIAGQIGRMIPRSRTRREAHGFPQRAIQFFLHPNCPVSTFVLNTPADIHCFAASLPRWNVKSNDDQEMASRTFTIRSNPALDQSSDIMRREWGGLLVNAVQQSLNVEKNNWRFDIPFTERRKAAIRRYMQRNKAIKIMLFKEPEEIPLHIIPAFFHEALQAPRSVTLVCHNLMKLIPAMFR